MLKIETLKEIANDYAAKLATPIYIGIRAGYLENEAAVRELASDKFIIDTPMGIVQQFTKAHLSNEKPA